MKYIHYPGCSLKSTGKPYEESLLAVCRRLDFQMEELAGWNCCGATAYMSIDETEACALAARNLAQAESLDGGQDLQLVTPCSACYLVLSKTQHRIKDYPGRIGQPIIQALRQAGLNYRGDLKVRHPLDVFVNDIGLDKLKVQAKQPLKGLKVACYYGCQVVRPYATFDNEFDPQSMDNILRAMGADTIEWPLKSRCCGGTLTGTIEEAGLRLSYILLKEARRRGADVVATACPLCQFNLECYQDRMRQAFDATINMPVAYFTQLMGMAMGLSDHELGLQRMFVTVPRGGAMQPA